MINQQTLLHTLPHESGLKLSGCFSSSVAKRKIHLLSELRLIFFEIFQSKKERRAQH